MKHGHPTPDAGGPPLLIGWKEYVALPDWGIRRVKAKIDTGARTSALDVPEYELVQLQGVGLVARLRVAVDRKHPAARVEVQVPVERMVIVCNSVGMREERPLLHVTIRLGPVERRIPITVTNRSGMLFRMILGRSALAGRFVVDVSQKYLLKKKGSGARGQGSEPDC